MINSTTLFPKVAIIVLNWNNYDDTANCIDHLERLAYPNFSIIVIDNDSIDGSGNRLENHFGRAHTVIINSANLGYTGGNNVGMKFAIKKKADYIFIINNDTVITDQLLLNKMVDFIKNKQNIGIIGPKIVSSNGKVTFTNYYDSRWWSKIESKYSLKFDKYGNGMKLSSRLLGAALLINTKLINKIGMFDESFFMYSDEDDFSLRAIINGYDVVYYPSVIVYRKTENDGNEYNIRSTYYTTRNKVHMLRKNLKGTFRIYMLAYNFVGELRKIVLNMLKGNYKISFYLAIALVDGIKGSKGLNDKIK